MLDKTSFKSFAEKIIFSVYSDRQEQLVIYKLEGNQLIDQLYSGLSLENYEAETVLEGGATIKDIVEGISVIIGTYKMVKDIYNLSKAKRPVKNDHSNEMDTDMAAIKEKWKQKLREQEVGEETATVIVEGFSEDMKKILDQ